MNRIKVRKFYSRNIFCERSLLEWKNCVEDRSLRSVLARAHINACNYPLEIRSVTDLKRIKGIGDTIAEKLDAAWSCFCLNYANPSVKLVRELGRTDILRFLQVSRSCGEELPKVDTQLNHNEWFQRRNAVSAGGAMRTRKEARRKNEGVSALAESSGCVSRMDSGARKVECIGLGEGLCLAQLESTNKLNLYHSPSEFNRSKIILIVDNAENNSCSNRSRSLSLHLQKTDLDFEFRSLSVGDYLWIIRKSDGTELVLSYVIERKTIEDLLKSIVEGRYKEQKQRLKQTNIQNIIYLLEGKDGINSSSYQSLVTTHVHTGFLIYHTMNAKETVLFLRIITNRLVRKAKFCELVGVDFLHYQKLHKKTQKRTVSELFWRQLTVCPHLSAGMAKLITDHFPTLTALKRFYASAHSDDRSYLLSNYIKEIPKSVSIRISKFFNRL